MVLVQVIGLAFERTVDIPTYDLDWESAEEEREKLNKEIARLERELASVKAKSAKAIVSAKDKAKAEDVEKVQKELTEKELVVAALVSQVHDLKTQVEASKKADAENRAKVQEMERTRRLLERQIADMKGRKGVTLIPERGSSKIPIYMVCSSSGLEIHSPFENRPKKKILTSDVERGLGDFLSELDHTTHCVVLLVRPSGVRVMDRAVEILKGNSFAYGRDPLTENDEIVFDVGGAE